ncbi:MAG: ABC transporter substrate-binding protein [Bdellovibrionales bacterium]|nr:ABC transporter substrate-binding protein [Ramlibacter sp.]
MRGHLTSRRRLVTGAGLVMAALAAPALAQKSKSAATSAVVAQIVDISNEQQDVARDFLVGSRAAWQDINAKGGVRGRPVQHLSIETDGSPASLRAAVKQVKDNPACVVLSGTASDPVAAQLVALLQEDNTPIAHAAPWLQNSSVEVDDRTFPIFATRQEQIGHALKSLAVVGMQELGIVYATPREYGLYQTDVERIAVSLKLRVQSFRPAAGGLAPLGQGLGSSAPAVMLFVGGTPELVQFTQGLAKHSRQRYVIALADVNLQTMLQMGGSRATPVIATQAVPLVNQTSLPVVRAYRDTLARLFDEPPAALSLAGFIAARYTYEVLSDVDAALTRPAVLAAFQKRAPMDIGGFRIAFNAQRRGSSYVTQSMLATDGRLIG